MRERQGAPQSPEADQFSPLMERMVTSVKGMNIESLRTAEAMADKNAFKITVTDREAWNDPENSEQLRQFLGQTTWEAFSQREGGPDYDPADAEQRDETLDIITTGDLSESDEIFVAADGERVVGYITTSRVELPDDKKGCVLGLSAVNKEFRSKGIGRELYDRLFAEGNYDAILGCSATPAAIKTRLALGKKNGYETYFCGFKDGNYGDRGSAEEQERIKMLTEKTREPYIHSDVTIPPDQMPQDFIILREGEGLPPITRAEVDLSRLDRGLAETFDKHLLPTQEKMPKDTVYGVLISQKKD